MDASQHASNVAFEAVALVDATVVLRSEAAHLTDHDMLLEYAYMVDPKAPPEARRRMFGAERYGGLGIFNNGGGVRCGVLGDFQVKGIGLNPLLGRSTPSAYRSGALNGVEAAREFIWSSLLGSSLPNGAAEVVAVIDTGVSFKPRASPEFRRFLAVRQTRGRIAQFERAPHFRPSRKRDFPHDSQRTRCALESLAGEPLASASKDALDELFRRLHSSAILQAEQLAAAKMRRIYHGALSSSNAGIDGSWLDFGSLTHLPGFESPKDFRLGFWNEFEYLLHGFHEICHAAELYSYGAFEKSERFSDIANGFLQCYEGTLAKEACGLLGLESEFLDAPPAQLLEHLRLVGNGLLGALQARVAPSSWSVSADCPALTLPEKLARVICGKTDASALRDDPGVSRQLLDSAARIGKAYKSTHFAAGISKEGLTNALLLDATRRAAFVPALEAAVMNKAIESRAREGSLPNFASDLLHLGALVMRPRPGLNVPLGFGENSIFYDPSEGHHYAPPSTHALGKPASDMVGKIFSRAQLGGFSFMGLE